MGLVSCRIGRFIIGLAALDGSLVGKASDQWSVMTNSCVGQRVIGCLLSVIGWWVSHWLTVLSGHFCLLCFVFQKCFLYCCT